MTFEPPPAWQLPDGVDAPLWRYAHTPRLAVEEDLYFAGHPLFERDAQLLDERFSTPGSLIDLGCGAGRHAIRFARRGFTVTAVDLSRSMLEVVIAKAHEAGVAGSISCLQANLCHLESVPDATFDLAISMFSTLGMIRGANARRRALGEACRILRPGGRLAIHAHNLWLNLRDPQGRRWLASHLAQRWLRRGDLGGRRMTYRGVAGMEVHLYRWRELVHDLKSAGWRIDEAIPIDAVRASTIAAPWLLPQIRAGGWIVFASRST